MCLTHLLARLGQVNPLNAICREVEGDLDSDFCLMYYSSSHLGFPMSVHMCSSNEDLILDRGLC